MVTRLTDRLSRTPPLRFWRRFQGVGPAVLAAAVAFNLFFSIVPAMVAGLAGASVLGTDAEARAETERALSAVAPEPVAERFTQILGDVSERVKSREGLVVLIAAAVALWSGSRGILTIQRSLSRLEGIPEDRPWWVVRLIGIALTFGVYLALITSSILLIGGEQIADRLSTATGLFFIDDLWRWTRVPAASAGLFLFLFALYRFGPPRPLPGSALAAGVSTVGVVAASLGFRQYLDVAGELGATLASLGAVALTLVWLYLVAWVILLAASLTAAGWRRWRGEEETAVEVSDDVAEDSLRMSAGRRAG